MFCNQKCFLTVKLFVLILSFHIYLGAVFRSFGYLQYSNMIYFLSEEYTSIWEEHQKVKIVCVYKHAH